MAQEVTVSIEDAHGNKLRDQAPIDLPVTSDQLIDTFKGKGVGTGELLDARGHEVPLGRSMEAGNYRYRVTATGESWTGPKSFIYSEYLVDKLGMAAPYEQYTLYGTILGGLGYTARSFWRAHMVMKSAHEPDPVKAKDLRLFAAATVDQVEAAALWAGRFRTRGVIYGLGAPFLWTAFTLGRHALQSSGRS